MARKATNPKIVSPGKMAEMMSALYPVRAGKNGLPRFWYDFVICPADSLGLCIHPSREGKGIRRLLARYAEFSGRDRHKVFDEVCRRNTAILIVDPIAYEAGNWHYFLLVALHEYAHYLCRSVASLYNWDLRANSFERTLGLLEEFNQCVYGRRTFKKAGPLFGDWCLWEGGHDPVTHDPLFFFVLYFLERKAHDMGYFGVNATPLYDEEP